MKEAFDVVSAVSDDQYSELKRLSCVPREGATSGSGAYSLADYVEKEGIMERLKAFHSLLKERIPDDREAEDLRGLVELATETPFRSDLARFGKFREFFELIYEAPPAESVPRTPIAIADYLIFIDEEGRHEKPCIVATCHFIYFVKKRRPRNSTRRGGGASDETTLILAMIGRKVREMLDAEISDLPVDPLLLVTAEQEDPDRLNNKKIHDEAIRTGSAAGASQAPAFARPELWLKQGLYKLDMFYEQPALNNSVRPAQSLLLRAGLFHLNPEGKPVPFEVKTIPKNVIKRHLEKFFACSCLKKGDIQTDPSVKTVLDKIKHVDSVALIAESDEQLSLKQRQANYHNYQKGESWLGWLRPSHWISTNANKRGLIGVVIVLLSIIIKCFDALRWLDGSAKAIGLPPLANIFRTPFGSWLLLIIMIGVGLVLFLKRWHSRNDDEVR